MSDSTSGAKGEIVRRFLTQTRSVDEFASYFTEDAFYRVGNTEPLIGRDRIRESSVRFRQAVKSIVHDVKQIWEMGNTVIVEIDVTYTRNDGKIIKLPCLDVVELEGDKFKAIHIYMDISPVFAP
jgi:ketosteroid isomerase-like protein